jgi:chromosome segregation ATPase
MERESYLYSAFIAIVLPIQNTGKYIYTLFVAPLLKATLTTFNDVNSNAKLTDLTSALDTMSDKIEKLSTILNRLCEHMQSEPVEKDSSISEMDEINKSWQEKQECIIIPCEFKPILDSSFCEHMQSKDLSISEMDERNKSWQDWQED